MAIFGSNQSCTAHEGIPKAGCFRALLMVLPMCALLTGCPMPIPVCEKWKYLKPGIDVTELMPVHEKVPAGSALVFGRVHLRGLKEKGAISLRLVSFRRPILIKEEPHGEREVWLSPDGRFQWILPAGRYAIQPINFHYGYSGTGYQKKKTIITSMRPNCPAGRRIQIPVPLRSRLRNRKNCRLLYSHWVPCHLYA